MNLVDIYKRAAWKDKLQKSIDKMVETNDYWICTYAHDAAERNMERYQLTDFHPSILQVDKDSDFFKTGITKEELEYYNSQVK